MGFFENNNKEDYESSLYNVQLAHKSGSRPESSDVERVRRLSREISARGSEARKEIDWLNSKGY